MLIPFYQDRRKTTRGDRKLRIRELGSTPRHLQNVYGNGGTSIVSTAQPRQPDMPLL